MSQDLNCSFANPNTTQKSLRGTKLADYLNPPSAKANRYKSPSITSDQLFNNLSAEPKHILDKERFVTTSQVDYGRAPTMTADMIKERLLMGKSQQRSNLIGILPGTSSKEAIAARSARLTPVSKVSNKTKEAEERDLQRQQDLKKLSEQNKLAASSRSNTAVRDYFDQLLEVKKND